MVNLIFDKKILIVCKLSNLGKAGNTFYQWKCKCPIMTCGSFHKHC